MRVILSSIVTSLVTLAVYQGATQRFDSVEAREFIVRAENGEVLARLGTGVGSATLEFTALVDKSMKSSLSAGSLVLSGKDCGVALMGGPEPAIDLYSTDRGGVAISYEGRSPGVYITDHERNVRTKTELFRESAEDSGTLQSMLIAGPAGDSTAVLVTTVKPDGEIRLSMKGEDRGEAFTLIRDSGGLVRVVASDQFVDKLRTLLRLE